MKILKKSLRRIINIKENVNWERNQDLHNLAYEIVERKINKEFQSPIYEVKPQKSEYDKDEMLVVGYTMLCNRVLNWRPKKPISEWTPLDKEIVHIMKVKEKIVSQKLLEFIYSL